MRRVVTCACSALAMASAAAAQAPTPAGGTNAFGFGGGRVSFGPWSAPINAESLPGSGGEVNTSSGDGCPIFDPFTNDLYIASSRSGGHGGLDIWMAEFNGAGWEDPINLPAPINSAADELCPTPTFGKLFFVSKRDEPNGDIYVAWRVRDTYKGLRRLPEPINSSAQEWSPSFVQRGFFDNQLYFSSTRAGGQDIYVANDLNLFTNTVTGPVEPVARLNTPFDDARPNVRLDGLEIVFDTTRDGSPTPQIWTSTRRSWWHPWRQPKPIDEVNDPAGQSRASISWDGRLLVFGSPRPGGEGASDVYVSTREKQYRRRR